MTHLNAELYDARSGHRAWHLQKIYRDPKWCVVWSCAFHLDCNLRHESVTGSCVVIAERKNARRGHRCETPILSESAPFVTHLVWRVSIWIRFDIYFWVATGGEAGAKHIYKKSWFVIPIMTIRCKPGVHSRHFISHELRHMTCHIMMHDTWIT